MTYILFLIIFLTISTSFSIYFKKKIEYNFILTIFLIIFIELIFGILFNNLRLGTLVIIFVSIIASIYNIITLKNSYREYKQYIFTNGLLIFFISYCFIIVLTWNKVPIENDEFSHWALIVKNMYYHNTLGVGTDSTVLCKSYLSGTSIFQAFSTFLNPKYDISIAYFSMDIMYISFILPFISTNKFKNMLINYCVLLLFPTILSITYLENSLMVDSILGICFALIIFIYFKDDNTTIFKYIILYILFCYLILIKDFGIVLLLIAYLIIIIYSFFYEYKHNLKKFIKEKKLLICVILPAILLKFFWQIYLDNNLIFSFSTNSSSAIKALIQFITFNLSNYEMQITFNFLISFYTNNLFINHSTGIVCTIIYLILSLIVINKTKSKKFKYILFASFVGLIIYCFFLNISYIGIFDSNEATNLHSFTRYLHTYILGMFYLIIIYYINEVLINKKTHYLILAIITGLSVYSYIFSLNIDNTRLVDYNKDFKDFDYYINKYTNENDKIYFVYQIGDGITAFQSQYIYYVANYKVTPRKMNDGKYSLGNKYFDNDYITVNYDNNELKQILIEEYDYVYLYEIDEQFISKYKNLFAENVPINEQQLYKINKLSKNNNILSLVED